MAAKAAPSSSAPVALAASSVTVKGRARRALSVSSGGHGSPHFGPPLHRAVSDGLGGQQGLSLSLGFLEFSLVFGSVIHFFFSLSNLDRPLRYWLGREWDHTSTVLGRGSDLLLRRW